MALCNYNKISIIECAFSFNDLNKILTHHRPKWISGDCRDAWNAARQLHQNVADRRAVLKTIEIKLDSIMYSLSILTHRKFVDQTKLHAVVELNN